MAQTTIKQHQPKTGVTTMTANEKAGMNAGKAGAKGSFGSNGFTPAKLDTKKSTIAQRCFYCGQVKSWFHKCPSK